MQVQQDLPHIDSVSLMWLEVQEVQTLQLAAGVCLLVCLHSWKMHGGLQSVKLGCNMLKRLWLQELNLTQSTSLGRQIEVQMAFAPATNMSQGGQQPFSVGIQLSTGQGTSTLITVNGTAAATTNGTLQIAQVPANRALMLLSSLR